MRGYKLEVISLQTITAKPVTTVTENALGRLQVLAARLRGFNLNKLGQLYFSELLKLFSEWL